MTARTSFFFTRRIRRPAYFSPCAAAPAERAATRAPRRRARQRREQDRERRRRAARRPRRRAAARPRPPRPAARARGRRASARPRSRAPRRPTPTIRPGHQVGLSSAIEPARQQRAEHQRDDAAGRSPTRSAARRRRRCRRRRRTTSDHEQETGLLQEREVRALEVQSEVGARRARRPAAWAGTDGSRSPRRCRDPAGDRGDSPWRASVLSRRMTIDETTGPPPAPTRSSATAGCSPSARAG